MTKNLAANGQNLAILELNQVIEDFVSLKRSNHTKRAYKNDIEQFFYKLDMCFLDDLGRLPFSALVRTLQGHVTDIKKVEKLETRERVTNARTVNRKIQSLRSFFDYLVKVYRYPQNPLDQIQKLKTENFSNTQSLNRSEVVDLLAVARGRRRENKSSFRDYLVFVCLFNLALRVDEAANLQWNDLDLTNQVIKVYQKGGSTKVLPLPGNIAESFKEFHQLHANNCTYIFQPARNNSHKTTDKPISTQSLFKIVTKLAGKVIPGKKITPHSLRKTFIEQALNNNEDLISICNATGHNSIEMVKYYDTRDRIKNNAIHSVSRTT